MGAGKKPCSMAKSYVEVRICGVSAGVFAYSNMIRSSCIDDKQQQQHYTGSMEEPRSSQEKEYVCANCAKHNRTHTTEFALIIDTRFQLPAVGHVEPLACLQRVLYERAHAGWLARIHNTPLQQFSTCALGK